MAEFVAQNSEVEVSGQAVYSIVDGMGVAKDMAYKILSENNIDDPQEGKWFMQQDWLNAFRQISDTIGHGALFDIGQKIPVNADFPPEDGGLLQALESIDIAYHMNHRLKGKIMYDEENGIMTEGIGHYHFRKLDENKAMLICDNPYPCEFDKGIIDTMVEKFRPENVKGVNVEHDESQGCRKNGGDSCIYTISWTIIPT